MSEAKTVAVLGAGVGGLIAAQELRKRLPRQHRVILIDRVREHLFAPSLLWLMVGLRQAHAIKRPLSGLERKGIELRFGEVEKIDPQNRTLTIDGQSLTADYIVVSLGAELVPEIVPGLNEAGHNFYTLSGAENFYSALKSMRSGRLVILTAAPVYKCPAAPYEAALLVDHFCRKHGIRRSLSMDMYAAEPGPMGVAGPAVSAGVKQMLASRHISYHPAQQIEAVDVSTKRLKFADGLHADFDLLAYVPPHRSPRVIRESALAGEGGWILVDRQTLETRFPGVYALGDVVSIPLALGKPLPKAGVFAHGEAKVVAKNIAREITGRGTKERFDGYGACFVEVGGGRAGIGKGNFYAEPVPDVKLRAPSWHWHAAKVLFEKSWLMTKL